MKIAITKRKVKFAIYIKYIDGVITYYTYNYGCFKNPEKTLHIVEVDGETCGPYADGVLFTLRGLIPSLGGRHFYLTKSSQTKRA